MEPIKGYLCGTDLLDIKLGADDIKIFSSIETLKEARLCWEECGIVEIELNPKVIVKGTLYENKSES